MTIRSLPGLIRAGALARLAVILPLLFALPLTPRPAAASFDPHGGMIRYPAISAERIVFHYAGDLWSVDRAGGLASPLAASPGAETRPRFSPDGRRVAFVGNYEGGTDIYVIDVEGGVPHRVTHHPARESLQQWTRDGRLLYFSGATGAPRGNPQLFFVDPEGGLPERLPVLYGAMAAISDDGRWLAFTPHTRDHRTWKRYRGGMSTDLWLYDLKDGTSERITDWEGTDTEPMWHGKEIYYLSDQGPEHRWNLWVYDTRTRQRRQVTDYADYDVKMPSIGPGDQGQGEIVFQKGSSIHVLDLGSGRVHEVSIRIPGDRPRLMPQRKDVSPWLVNMAVSNTGKRALVEMRGDIWSLPAEKGVAVDLTRSSGVAERYPTWSPDGKWIAYFSDESGEYEIYLRSSDGKGDPRRLGEFGAPYRMSMSWSPKSDRLAYMDKTGTLYLVDVDNGKRTLVHSDYLGDEFDYSWSHDGEWIAFELSGDNLQTGIGLYEVSSGETHRLTAGFFVDGSPAFDRAGDFLYYVSQRDFSEPTYEDVGTTFVYDRLGQIVAAPLRADVELPGLPEEDHEEVDAADDEGKKGDQDADEKDEDDEEKEEAVPLVIDLDGFEARTVVLPIERGRFGQLAVADGGALVYTRFDGEKPSIRIYDPSEDEPEEKTVLDGFGSFRLTADGKKLLVRRGSQLAIVDAKPDQEFEATIDVSGLEATIDPRAEWQQIFDDAWRLMRDFFYDPHMHGVDWKKIKKQYAAMLEDCASRDDVGYVIREMISELNVGHAYYFGGDTGDEPRRNVGLLGVDFEIDHGAYRIARIYEGGAWDTDARSPLRTASGEVHEGDYLLAVNGVPVDPALDPWVAFIGTAEKTTRLTVSEHPKLDDEAREVLVVPLSSERVLRYRAWIEANRRYVEEKSGGQVGYIYVPNTGVEGQSDLFRQFYGQRNKKALIIDERWNGGGQIPTRFIELLNRPVTNYWAVRDGERKNFPWPPDAHQGPKCMLINGLAGSGGDAFPAYFRQAGLGELIGERTWGGLVGIGRGPVLIDGAFLSEPSFAYYEKDGTWGIEGHGVDPDIEVVADPAALAKGIDPQLDTAIERMLEEIEAHPYVVPPVPDYPDRSGMGIREEDM